MSNYILLPSHKRALKLARLSGDIQEETAQEAKQLGYMARLLLMVNLPYRDPGNVRVWLRKNGAVTIIITPAYNNRGECLGIPYGSYPRLILAYLITEAVKSKSPEIFVGKNFYDFVKLLGIQAGGKQYKQLEKQLQRTLSAAFAWTYENEIVRSRENIQIAHRSALWWDPKAPGSEAQREHYVKLNTDFYNEVIKNAVPLDLRIVGALKNSPLGLDLYMFLSWRAFPDNLKKPCHIPWDSLHRQLGGQYKDIKVFARDCKKHIKQIKAFWPELQVSFSRGMLCLKPTVRTLVSPVYEATK